MSESHALASEVERGRRDLLDRLLSGRPPGPDEERRAEALGPAARRRWSSPSRASEW